MNKLEMLLEERDDLIKASECLQESLKYLNPMRDLDFYQVVEGQKKLITKQISYLETEIEKTKESFNAVVVSYEESGAILAAKNLEGKDVFLRIGYLPERAASNKANAFVLDWVDKIEDDCFIVYKEYSITQEEFKEIYKFHKKHRELEKSIRPRTLELRETELEIKRNYSFKRKNQ